MIHQSLVKEWSSKNKQFLLINLCIQINELSQTNGPIFIRRNLSQAGRCSRSYSELFHKNWADLECSLENNKATNHWIFSQSQFNWFNKLIDEEIHHHTKAVPEQAQTAAEVSVFSMNQPPLCQDKAEFWIAPAET